MKGLGLLTRMLPNKSRPKTCIPALKFLVTKCPQSILIYENRKLFPLKWPCLDDRELESGHLFASERCKQSLVKNLANRNSGNFKIEAHSEVHTCPLLHRSPDMPHRTCRLFESLQSLKQYGSTVGSLHHHFRVPAPYFCRI